MKNKTVFFDICGTLVNSTSILKKNILKTDYVIDDLIDIKKILEKLQSKGD